jgi:hypothetical protein
MPHTHHFVTPGTAALTSNTIRDRSRIVPDSEDPESEQWFEDNNDNDLPQASVYEEMVAAPTINSGRDRSRIIADSEECEFELASMHDVDSDLHRASACEEMDASSRSRGTRDCSQVALDSEDPEDPGIEPRSVPDSGSIYYESASSADSSCEDYQSDSSAASSYEEFQSDDNTRRKRGRSSKRPTKRLRRQENATIGTALKFETSSKDFNSYNLNTDALAIEIDGTTHILNRLVKLLREHAFSTTRSYKYTPNFDRTTHVLDLPLYDPETRKYELIVPHVALYDHEMSDGGLTRAWRLQARNTMAPDEAIIDLFTMHTAVKAGAVCPPCRDDAVYITADTCQSHSATACDYCIQHKDPEECIRRCALMRDVGYNIITDQVCDETELDKVVALGQLKVEIMNRVPLRLDLDINSWRTVYRDMDTSLPPRCSPLRTYIDTTSLVTWKQRYNPSFDLSSLGYIANGHWRSIWTVPYFGGGRKVVLGKTSAKIGAPPTTWALAPHSARRTIKSAEENFSRRITISIPYKGVDVIRAKQLDDYALYQVFNLSPLKPIAMPETTHEGACNIKSEPKDMIKRAAVSVIEHICFKMAGHIGTLQAFRSMMQQQKLAFSGVDQIGNAGGPKEIDRAGPYNGSRIWRKPFSAPHLQHVRIALSAAALRDIDTTDDDDDNIKARLCITTLIRDRACLAYIMQATVDALSRGEGLLQAIFAAHIVAQYLEARVLTKIDVLDQYCTCVDLDMQARTEHLCMSCYSPHACTDLVSESTETGTLLECLGCSSRAPASRIRVHHRDVIAFIKMRVTNAYHHDSIDIYGSDSDADQRIPWTKPALVQKLVETSTVTGQPTLWIDGYSKKTIEMSDSIWSEDTGLDLRLMHKHPTSPSMEKPFPRVKRIDGTMALHDIDNVILCALCINILKGRSTASSLPLLKKAIQLRKDVDGQEPTADYAPALRASWDILERVSDPSTFSRLVY